MEKYHENATPRDGEYVKAYLKTHSQNKAAKLCNVSRETIARAVRRAGIQLSGRKYNRATNNLKITDAELREDSKTLNAIEIAKKHKMSVEAIIKRAKKLNIELIPVEYGHWLSRAKRYGIKSFDKTISLKELIKRDGGICQICGKPVNENDVIKGHIRKDYPTVDHIIPMSKGGTHTWDNVQLAHMKCNAGKCDKIMEVG